MDEVFKPNPKAKPKVKPPPPLNASQIRARAKAEAKAKAKAKGKAKAQAVQEPELIMCPFPGCGQMCRGKLGLARHTQMKHTEGTKAANGFQCDLCPYFTKSQKALTEHKRNPINHTPEAFLCPKCNAHFPNRNTRNRHALESCHLRD